MGCLIGLIALGGIFFACMFLAAVVGLKGGGIGVGGLIIMAGLFWAII